MITQATIQQAATRLAQDIRRTPVLDIHDLPYPVTLKLEQLQHSGSFKARGALNMLASSDIPPTGVVAASGGNHGAAVAWAAQRLGCTATIFVPQRTPAIKTDRIRAYGATIVQGGAAYADAFEASQAFQAQTGALSVHAYDDPAVLSGQGTIGRELSEQAPGLTHLLVAVGGGGLIGGIATWFERSATTIIAVEPKTCPTLHAALHAGRPVPVDVSGPAADSLGARVIGNLAFAVAARTELQSVLIDDGAIEPAQHHLWNHLRLIVEPGGAVALAALLSGAWAPPAGARVGVLLCGANTNPCFT